MITSRKRFHWSRLSRKKCQKLNNSFEKLSSNKIITSKMHASRAGRKTGKHFTMARKCIRCKIIECLSFHLCFLLLCLPHFLPVVSLPINVVYKRQRCFGGPFYLCLNKFSKMKQKKCNRLNECNCDCKELEMHRMCIWPPIAWITSILHRSTPTLLLRSVLALITCWSPSTSPLINQSMSLHHMHTPQ